MDKLIEGGCACGRTRYKGAAADAAPFRCYCRDCQRATGGGHSEMLPLIRDSFEVIGTLKEYQLVGGSGKPTWSGFCPDCGSPLMRRSARMSDRVYVHAASLDHPEHYAAGKELYTEAAQVWDPPKMTD